jgi:4-amino-4-deoxychorismate lyase
MDNINLREYIEVEYSRTRIKCRVIYNQHIISVEYDEYEQNNINTLKIIEDEAIEYKYKYLDRASIDNLFKKRDKCDDILIVKKGKITDCSFSNIAFFDGLEWITPDEPLLAGTQREFLIDSGIIFPRKIFQTDLTKYSKYRLFNAMINWDEAEDQLVENIIS